MSLTCPKCTAPFEEGSKFCATCGSNLEREYIEKPAYTSFQGSSGSTTPSAGNDYSLHLDDFAMGTGTYPKASLVNRLIAHVLDVVFALLLALPAVGMAWFGVAKMMLYDTNSGWGALVVAGFLGIIPLVYYMIKDGLGAGQSWGKRAMNLMVVNLEDRSPCTKGSSFLRNFVSALLGGIPYVGWLIEPIILLVTKDGRKAGDMAARTQVIEVSNFNFPSGK